MAVIELVPCAMLANGPPWTNAGTPSIVCTRLGLTASRSSAAIAPTALEVGGGAPALPSARKPTTMRAEPLLQIVHAAREAQDRHHLARRRDVEAGLARHALACARRAR